MKTLFLFSFLFFWDTLDLTNKTPLEKFLNEFNRQNETGVYEKVKSSCYVEGEFYKVCPEFEDTF